MADSQYISVRETAQLLGVSEKKIMDMIEDKTLHGYRIANQFLRLKKNLNKALILLWPNITDRQKLIHSLFISR